MDKLYNQVNKNSQDVLEDPSTRGVGGLSGINTAEGAQRELARQGNTVEEKPYYGPKRKQFTKEFNEGQYSQPLYGLDGSYENPNYENLPGDNFVRSPYSETSNYELKAQDQSTADKWANGILKTVTTAGITTIRSTAGLANGLIESVANDFDFSYMYRNTTDAWLSELEKRIENEWLPNYYTEEELNRPWYQNIFTANFLADGLVKNMGFTAGMIVPGSAFAAIAKGLGAGAMAAQVLGGIYSAYSEGKVEALQTYEQFLEEHTAKDDDFWRDETDFILEQDRIKYPDRYPKGATSYVFEEEAQYTPEGKEIQGIQDPNVNRPSPEALSKLNDLKAMKEMSAQEIEEQAKHAGNVNSVLNTVFLTLPLMKVFGRLFKGGYKSSRQLRKYVKKGADGKLIGKPKKLVKEVGKDAAWESFEEGTQGFTGEYSSDYYGHKVDEYRRALVDPEYEKEHKEHIQSVLDAAKNTYGNIDAYDEAFMGFTSAIIGFPMVNVQKGRRAERGGRWFDWYGGAAEHQTLTKEFNERLQKHVDYANNRKQQFEDFIDNFANSKESMDFIFNNNLQKRFDYKEEKALQEGDKVEFLNAVHSNLIADIVYFDNIGRLDEYQAMVESALDQSELNLKEIATMSADIAKDGRYIGPFIDANGKPMTLQKDGKEAMKEKLTKQAEYIQQTIKDYKELGDFIDKRTHVQLSDEQLQEMIWLGSSIRNQENRISEMNKSNKEVFSEIYQILKDMVSSGDTEITNTMSPQELSRAISKRKIRTDEQLKENMHNILYSLGKLQGMTDVQYKQYLKENKEFFNDLLNLLGNPMFALDKYKLQDTKERVEDSQKLMKDINDFQERFDSFLADPDFMNEHHEKIDEEVQRKHKLKELREGTKRLNKIKDYKEFIYTLLNNESAENLLDALVAKGNKNAINFARSRNAYGDINKQIKNSQDLSDVEKSVAIEVLNKALVDSDSYKGFIDTKSEAYNPQNESIFEDMPDMVSEDTKYKITDFIKDAFGKLKEDSEWKNKFKTRYKSKQAELKQRKKSPVKEKEETKNKINKKLKSKKEESEKEKPKKANNASTAESKGLGKKLQDLVDSENYHKKLSILFSQIGEDASIDNLMEHMERLNIGKDSDINKFFTGVFEKYLSGQYSYAHAYDLLTNAPTVYKGDTSKITSSDLQKSNKNTDNRQELLYKNKEHLYDAVPELKLKDGFLIPFEEALPQFKELVNYLRQKGKYDFVNSGKLKAGDEIRFTIFKEYNKKNKQDAIFMTTKDGQVVGVLQENTTNGEVVGLKELREDILAKSKKSSAAEYTYDVTTKVNTIMDGKIQFKEKESDLKDVSDLDASTALLSVINNGVAQAYNSKEQTTTPLDVIGKDGRVYLQIKTASGKRFPIMVRVKSLQDVNINSEEFQKTETYKILMDAINQMAESTTAEDVLAAREALSKILYIDNIKTNFRVSKYGKPFLSIVKVITDEFGAEVTEYNKALKKDVRKESEYKPIDMKDTSSTIIEFSSNGPGKDITEDSQISTEKIANEILQALIYHGASFQVSKNLINTPGYNERLINDGILTANINSVTQKSAWFIADPIINGKSVPVKYGGPINSTTKNPVGNIEGNKFRVEGKNYTVRDSKIYDSSGKELNNLPNEQLILDLDWAQKVYGNAKNGLGLKHGVCIIEGTNKVLDRNTHKYLEGNAKDKFLDSINKKQNNVGNLENKAIKSKISEVESQIEANQEKVDKDRTDGDYYYILEEDGEYHKYSRVTSHIGSNFTIPTSLQKQIDEVQGKLSLADSQAKADVLYKELIDEFGIELPESEFGESIIDQKRKVFNTVREKILSKIPNRNRSLEAGSAVDSIIRDFFNGVENISKPDNLNTFAFKELLANLEQVKKNMEKNGERFLTNNIVLFHKYADGTRIAGEVDILSINDKAQEISIYDVKTSKNPFYGEDGELHPYFINPYNKGQRSTYEQYTMQLSAYKNLFESQYDFSITSLAILPFYLSYEGNIVERIDRQQGIPVTFNPNVNVGLERSIPIKQEKNTPPKPKVHPKKFTDTTKSKHGSPIPTLEGAQEGFFETRDQEVLKGSISDLGNFFGMDIRVATVAVYNKSKPALTQFYIVLPNGLALPKYRQGFSIPLEEGVNELLKVLNDPDENVNGKNFLIKYNNMETSLNPKPVSKSEEVKAVKEDNNTQKPTKKFKETDSKDTEVKNAVEKITETLEKESGITEEQKKTDAEIAQKLLNNKRTSGNKTAAQRAKERREARKNKLGRTKKNKESLERKVDDPSRKVWNKEKEMSWMEKALPQLSTEERLQIHEGLIEVSSKGVKAWGQFIDNIIKLSDVAAEGTLYHEAFHGVFNLLMSPEERSSTLDFVRNLKGNNSKSQTALEEIMAEDFRIYATTRNSFLGKAKQSIKDFYNKVMTFLGIKEDISELTSLYKNIYDGKYADAQLKLEDKITREFFHGSAAQKIDEFSFDYLLQGEGVNAFTAGFYFTETNSEANMYRIRALTTKHDNVVAMLGSVINTVKSSIDFGNMNLIQASYLSSLQTIMGSIQRYALKMNAITNAETLNSALQNKAAALSKIIQNTSDINILNQLLKQSENLANKLSESNSNLENLKDNLLTLNNYIFDTFEQIRIFNAQYLLGDILKQGEALKQTDEGGLFKVELTYSENELIHLDREQNHKSSRAIIDSLREFYLKNLDKNSLIDALLYINNSGMNLYAKTNARDILDRLEKGGNIDTLIKEFYNTVVRDDSRRVVSLIKFTENIFSRGVGRENLPEIQKKLTKYYLESGFVGASHYSGFSKSDHIIMYDTSRIKNNGNVINPDGKINKNIHQALLNELTDNQKIPIVDKTFENKLINVSDELMGDVENGIDVINSNNILSSLLNTPVENINNVLSRLSSDDLQYIEQVFIDEVNRLQNTGATVLGNRFIFETNADLNIVSSKGGKEVSTKGNTIDIKGKKLSDILYKDKFTKPEVKGLHETLSSYLGNFGVNIFDANKVIGSDQNIIDFTNKIIYAKNKSDIPTNAGHFIAFMMQKNPVVQNLFMQIAKEESGNKFTTKKLKEQIENNPTEYSEKLGEYLGRALKTEYSRLEGDKSFKNKLSQVVQVIKEFFNKIIFRDKLFFRMQNDLYNIANGILNNNTEIINEGLNVFKEVPVRISNYTIGERSTLLDRINDIANLRINGQALFSLSGPTALMFYGSIYRPLGEQFTSIDVVANNSFSNKEILNKLGSRFGYVVKDVVDNKNVNNGTQTINTSVIISRDGYKVYRQGDIFVNDQLELVGTLDVENNVINIAENQKYKYDILDLNIHKEDQKVRKALLGSNKVGLSPINLQEYKNVINSMLSNITNENLYDYNNFKTNSYRRSDMSHISSGIETINNSFRPVSNLLNVFDKSNKFSLLSTENRMELIAQNISEEMYNKMSDLERDSLLKCLGIN